MKILKKIGLAVVLLIGLIVGLAMFLPNTKVDAGRKVTSESNVPSSATQTAAAIAPAVAQTVPEKAAAKPAIQRAHDECIDGICIGAHPSELPKISWTEFHLTGGNDLSKLQRETEAREEKSALENCVRRQEAWGNKATAVCEALIHGHRSYAQQSSKPLATEEAIAFYRTDQPHICPFVKDEYENYDLNAMTNTSVGKTMVRIRLDSQGVMRVFSIEKKFKSENTATASALVEKLKEKHPYLSPQADLQKTLVGSTPAGTKIELDIHNDDPNVTMKADASLFDPRKIAACNTAKAVSVQ
jgi:hypothetical protein